MKTLSGVYFLIQDDEVVYIGSSKDINRRILEHGDKIFSCGAIIECSTRQMLNREYELISEYLPRYNDIPSYIKDSSKRKMSGGESMTMDELCQALIEKYTNIERENHPGKECEYSHLAVIHKMVRDNFINDMLENI